MDQWTEQGDGDRRLDEIVADLTRERMGHGSDHSRWMRALGDEAMGFFTSTYGMDGSTARKMVKKAEDDGETSLAEMVAWMRLLHQQGRDTLVAERLKEGA